MPKKPGTIDSYTDEQLEDTARKTLGRKNGGFIMKRLESGIAPTDDHIAALAMDEEQIVRLARINRTVFNTYVLRDDAGKPVIPGHIHHAWNRHIEYSVKTKKYCGIVAPFGHGKTEQLVIGGTLFDLARNPQARQTIVCSNDDNAQARIQSIKAYIEESKEFQRVFPEIEPDYKRGWSGHRLFVRRAGASKDPTVAAHGVLSSGIGTRLDSVKFDDVCDFKNTILEPKKRQLVKDAIRQTWLSRIDEHPETNLNYPQVLYVATVWHEQDATYEYVMRNSQFATLFMGISQPHMKFIECELLSSGGGRKNQAGKTWYIPLWDKKFDTATLKGKRASLGERAFARGFMNKPYSDDDILLKSMEKCLHYDTDPWTAMRSLGTQWRTVVGVDPAGEKRRGFAIFVLACERHKKIRIPLDIRIGAWSGKQAMSQINAVADQYQPDYFMVENNAVQGRVIDWMRDMGGDKFLVKPFNTGGNKADPEAGLPGLDIEFANDLWYIALGHVDHRDRPDCDCAWCRWRNEVLFYPLYVSSDLLMASWFAREGVRGGASMEELLGGIASFGKRTVQESEGLKIGEQHIDKELRPAPHIAGDSITQRIARMGIM